ncbi:glycosyltransferase family 2 protein [Nesterenkonia sandarakina]|uniref:Glycosyltransferase involved in cell wall biosynthesis n=1 Tax=Nesterenkonia sandarakina TaxID=272918 RepID=A0A2T0YSS6_9MICC|nr:glycosyltransferase family 2 protein [Nesterenkonia sandarakina]PRZ18834.1 glycosyltransferase involved in cell wall biosynthesis [Nesterenkonia sandarakina]
MSIDTPSRVDTGNTVPLRTELEARFAAAHARSLTAIIPTVGRRSLKRAVRSVLRQSWQTTALVVLDRPENAASVERLLAGLPHIMVVTPGGLGGAGARNLGVRSASTTHVAFLDDDDEWVSEKAALQMAVVDDDTVVSSRSLLVGSSSRVVPERLYQSEDAQPVVDYILDRSTLRLRRTFMQTSSLLCSRATALEVPWNDALTRHQDWDWLARLEAAGKTLTMLPEVLVRVHQASDGSISRSADWQASSRWIDSIDAAGTEISPRSRADFRASVVARDAFASGAWNQGIRQLAKCLRARPHAAAVVVAMSGMLQVGGHG